MELTRQRSPFLSMISSVTHSDSSSLEDRSGLITLLSLDEVRIAMPPVYVYHTQGYQSQGKTRSAMFH